MIVGWYGSKTFSLQMEKADLVVLDRVTCYVCIRYFKLCVLPMEDHAVSRNWKC